jgi:hypothetical protein
MIVEVNVFPTSYVESFDQMFLDLNGGQNKEACDGILNHSDKPLNYRNLF